MVLQQPEEARIHMNTLGGLGKAFFFMTDFTANTWFIMPLEDSKAWGLAADLQISTRRLKLGGFEAPGHQNHPARITSVQAIPRETYHRGFSLVQDHLRRGNSFLVNLTYPSRIELSTGSAGLAPVFRQSKAPCRLIVYDPRITKMPFTVFSPERFIRIQSNTLSSYPMKGTIRFSQDIPDQHLSALNQLMADEKESAEHRTVVDLIRNDIGITARRVWVQRYRFPQEITLGDSTLITTSTQVCGELPAQWHRILGDILTSQLPAGSVSGAPKKKTLEIIQEAELDDRGFYSGVAGVFIPDGSEPILESWVLIRYIEQTALGYNFRSGGGITIYSREEEEYNELRHKIAIPLG